MSVGVTPSTPGGAGAVGAPARAHDWQAIRALPEYAELVRRRRRFIGWIMAVALGTLAAFTVLVCWARDAMATEIVDGVSLAYVLGVAEMVLTAALGAAYVRIARTQYEPLERAVRAAAERAKDGR